MAKWDGAERRSGTVGAVGAVVGAIGGHESAVGAVIVGKNIVGKAVGDVRCHDAAVEYEGGSGAVCALSAAMGMGASAFTPRRRRPASASR